MTAIAHHPRPGNSRQPRQPDGRGRRGARRTAIIGRAAVPSGASTGAHEAHELRDGGDALRRQGRAGRRSRPSTARSATRSTGFDAADQRGLDQRLRDLDGTDEQEAARRQRHSRRVARRRPRPRPRAHGLPLYRYVGGAERDAAAGADDEHHQRRRACRQSDRLPGIHDRAGRRREHRRGRAHGRRSLPRAQARAEGRRPQHQRRRRGRLRAQSRLDARGARLRHGGDRGRRLQARARTSISRSTWRRPSSSARTAISSRARSGASTAEQMAAYLRRAGRRLSDLLHRGRHERGRLGRLARADRGAGRPRASSSATICSSPTSRG